MNIIGIAGRAGSGKDTAADVLVKRFGFVKMALADPLKRICREVFNFTDEQLWGPSEKRNEPDRRWPLPLSDGRAFLTPRHALQQLGTEWGRGCSPNVWVDYAMRIAKAVLEENAAGWFAAYDARRGVYGKLQREQSPAKGVVIADVRFPNEVEAIRAAGGRIWRIDRPAVSTAEAQEAWRQHVSEAHADGFDADTTIFNDAAVEQFRVAVDFAYQHNYKEVYAAGFQSFFTK